jgi:hypothetical protein
VTESGLPEDVRDFLKAHIRSVGELEVLLLLRRQSGRWWTADQVNRELKTSLQSALKHLEDLRDAQLVQERRTTEREFRFQAADPAVVPVVDELAVLFKNWVASIVNVIYSPRPNSIRQFADAFRLGKKGDEDDG